VKLLYIDVMAMIKNAKSLEEKPSKKASKKEEVEIAQLSELAKLDALIKTLTAMKANVEMSVKEAAFTKFIDDAKVTHKKVDSFRGIDGDTSASMEMRKRSTASKLSAEEVAYLTSKNVPVETLVETQKLFAINPKYASDEVLMEKVEAAMEKALKDIVDTSEFFVVQDERSKTVVSDETIAKAFAGEIDEQVIRMITVMAVKPKCDSFDIVTTLKSVLASCESVEENSETEETVKVA